ncbi:MAG: tetratricopeptide repeat protein, partial [Magnetovibrio sp.]|nr:tetratricopeptide repeat protein [Magnetovibrio sp.]
DETPRPGSEATAKTAAAASQSATPSLSTPATTTTAAATAATAATVGQPLALKPVPAQAAKPKADGESAEAAKDDGEKTADGEPAPPPEPKSPKAGVKLKFAWDEPVAAAVFRRVGFIWVIFDKASKVDVQSLLREGTGIISGIDQAPTPTATVLRFKTSDRVNPRLLRDGLSWIIEVREQPLVTASPFEIKAQPDSPVGARIFVPVPEPGQPVGITDPEIGDNLVVIPVIPLGHGTAQAYTYSQVRILQTAQGIVVKPLVDDLRVRPLRQGVELTSGAKLALTPVSADVAASAKLSALKPLTKIFELDKWELKDTEKFIDRKQELQNEVAVSRGEQRELKRYNLARFFFANRFTAETLGVLDRMKEQRPEVEDQPEYRLIRGAASYLMGRLSDAAADFTHESLDGTGEANFWRAAVVAASGDLLAAAPELRRTGSVTRKYPRALKIPMGTLVADAAVEIGDIKTAKTFIDALKALSPGPAELAQVEFVEGRLLDLGGDVDGAITKWEAVQESRHGPSRAKATIARMELLLKLRRMEPKEAIEILERLRYAWRGDDFEFRLLRRLGGLYLDEGIYRNGLQALRQAATYFRDNEEAPQVTQQMADVFNGLYLDGNADSMPPVTAIAVYEEFKELTPAGVKGDEMIRKLADRLAGVDLLEQAAEILEGQIRFRLKGALKAEVGARLSVLYLLARYYDRSLAALDATNEPGQPEGLVTQRRHLRARALMGMGREEESLEILKKDKAPDADLLRAEIFWRSGDWANASQSLRKIVRESGAEKEKPLNPEQSQNVLNYSIALVLSGNERGLGRVRRDYGRALEATELKDAFRLVSAPTAFGLIDPASVERRVKLAEGFKTFLSAYKERLQKQGLSGMTSQTTADAGGAPGGAAGQSGERQGETKGG